MKALALVALVGCTPIYDAQYDDRASTLEQNRVEIVPAERKVSFITASASKLFYVDLDGDEQTPLFHSYDPVSKTSVAYEVTRDQTSISTTYQVGDQMFAQCGFSQAKAYDTATGTLIGTATGTGIDEKCVIDGNNVYFISSQQIYRWVPPATGATQVIDISTMTGASDIDTFGVLGDLVVFAEGGRLWKGSVGTGAVSRIQTADQTSVAETYDARGVIIEGAKGFQYIKLADSSTFYLADAISDGGYDLNFKHSDVQTLADGGNMEIVDPYVVYRGTDGIFALDLGTMKVNDILLDRGDDDFSQQPRYSDPVVGGGMVFTQDISEATNAPHPVYGVKLADRFPR